MHEHLAPIVYFLLVHFLYASLVCVAAWLVTSTPGASANVKYWIWVATFLNFVVPLAGCLDGFGAWDIHGATQITVLAAVGIEAAQHAALASVFLALWFIGTSLLLARLYSRIRAERRHASTAEHDRAPDLLVQGIPVCFSATRGPSVEGVLGSRIYLPHGIERQLSEGELDAVLAHEVTHAKRHDNLLRLMYEVALCVLWFHPFLWIMGSRLALYRELSCDEAAIRRASGSDLLSALAKLARLEHPVVLRSMASSQLSDRLKVLLAPQPRSARGLANTAVVAAFSALFFCGLGLTIAHTACCLVVRT